MINGETGTGKEHLARTIHMESARSAGPWRAINCGAIPESLVESVLFGYERGAFTGADKRSPGLFEQADGGTVFLDEIAELPRGAQAALLRVLENKTYQRVGGSQQLRADVRIVAARHCDLQSAVADGAFREDLLYRINTVTLELPPLRARRDEIEALAERFLADCNRQWNCREEELAEARHISPKIRSVNSRGAAASRTWRPCYLRSVAFRAPLVLHLPDVPRQRRSGAVAARVLGELPAGRPRAHRPDRGLAAAGGSTDVLSEHSNISPKWAAQYREHLHGPSDRSNIREVISRINKEQKRKRG